MTICVLLCQQLFENRQMGKRMVDQADLDPLRHRPLRLTRHVLSASFELSVGQRANPLQHQVGIPAQQVERDVLLVMGVHFGLLPVLGVEPAFRPHAVRAAFGDAMKDR
jgi:hypothetical protein